MSILIKKTNKKTAVPALDRAVAVLDLLSHSQALLGAAEISRQLDIPRSSMHGLLVSMVRHGLLYKNSQQQYSMGSHVLNWAGGFIESQDIISTFHQQITELPEFSPFSLTLTLFDEKEVICLACRNGDGRLGFTFQIGLRLPSGFAATGRAVLSTRSDEEVLSIYQAGWHPPLTPYSMTDSRQLLKELEITRKRGYSIDDRQIRDGMFCIGAPIFDYSNTAKHGIALSLQKSQADSRDITQLGQRLRQLADRLSTHLGARL